MLKKKQYPTRNRITYNFGAAQSAYEQTLGSLGNFWGMALPWTNATSERIVRLVVPLGVPCN